MTDVTPDSMGLSWTVPEGEFDSFVLQYKDRDGQPHVVPVASDQREITIPGLEPNSKYKFLLYGLGGRKRLGPISAEGSTGEPWPCLHPTPRAPPPAFFQSFLSSEPPELAPGPSRKVYSPPFSLGMTILTRKANIY